MHNDPQAQPCSIWSSSVVACEAADKPGQERMEQPSLGDLGIEQDYDAVAVLGLRDMLRIDPRGCHGVPKDAVQARTHPGSRGIAPVQPAEALDVDRQNAPVFRFCAHAPTRLSRRSRRIIPRWTSSGQAAPAQMGNPRSGQGLSTRALSVRRSGQQTGSTRRP